MNIKLKNILLYHSETFETNSSRPSECCKRFPNCFALGKKQKRSWKSCSFSGFFYLKNRGVKPFVTTIINLIGRFAITFKSEEKPWPFLYTLNNLWLFLFPRKTTWNRWKMDREKKKKKKEIFIFIQFKIDFDFQCYSFQESNFLFCYANDCLMNNLWKFWWNRYDFEIIFRFSVIFKIKNIF